MIRTIDTSGDLGVDTKGKMEKPLHPIPPTLEAWLNEIALAYRDAHETIAFGKLIDHPVAEKDLFHLSPALCMKFRGIKRSKSKLKRATEAALSSYVATEKVVGDLFDVPQMVFAFCYVASHLGLDMLDEDESAEIIDYVEHNLKHLVELTKTK